LIGLFVRDESATRASFPHTNTFIESPRFRIVPGRSPIFVPVVPPDVAAWMKLDFPGVQSATRLASEEVGLFHGDFEASDYIAGQILMSSKSCRSRYLRGIYGRLWSGRTRSF